MSARDEYPELTVMAQHGLGADDQEAAAVLDALDAERAFADRLVAELNRHGWGDMHYGPQPQERSVVALVDEWMARRGVTERPDPVR